jgi:hypothetical protein
MVFACYLVMNNASGAEGWTHNDYRMYTDVINPQAYSSYVFGRTSMFYSAEWWYVYRYGVGTDSGYWIHKINPTSRIEENVIELVPTKIAFGNGTQCNTTGGTLRIFGAYCDISQHENNGYFDVVCPVYEYKGSNYTYGINVFHVHEGDMSYTEWAVPVGGCGSTHRMDNLKIADYSYQWTGNYERPIFYNDTDGHIMRVSWDTCSLGICSPKDDDDVREDRLPILSYDFLYDYLPVSEPNEPLKCFGTLWETYDCAPYVLYLARRDPYPNYQNLYVVEYSAQCDHSYGNPCPDCCIEGSISHSLNKMIIGRTDPAYYQDQELDQFTVYQRHSGTTHLWFVLWHSRMFQDPNTGGWTTCPSDMCWHISKFDQAWNKITTYNLNEFPLKGVYFINQTIDGGYHFAYTNYEVPSFYNANPSNMSFIISTCSYPVNITINSTTNTSHSKFLNITTCGSGMNIKSFNMSEFAGETVDMHVWNHAKMSSVRLGRGCSVYGFQKPWIIDPFETLYQITVGTGTTQCGGYYCCGDIDGLYYGDSYISEEYMTCSCTPWYNTTECAEELRKQQRTCAPAGCDITERWVSDPSCLYGGCYPPTWYCYNTTHLALKQSDCSWSSFTTCPYGCNQTAKACYSTNYCSGNCPNPEMTMRPFPDCSCECGNYCWTYMNLSESCACQEETPMINTTNWQEDPVSLFEDVASGMFILIGSLLVPIIIIFLALGFATILYLIFKKSVPRL